MFHLPGQLASSPERLVQQVSFFSAPASWVGGSGCHFASTLPFPPSRLPPGPATLTRANRAVSSASRSGPRARGAWMRRAAQGRSGGRRAGPASRTVSAARTGRSPPGCRGPDDRTTARCGRHQARQGAGEERGQSCLSPVSTLGGGKRPPQLLCRDGFGVETVSGTFCTAGFEV